MKPYFFFSHSSQDAHRIAPIKNRILESTGNSIEIFVSSDGASIPLGNNWLKEIEDALSNCRLMFVWVTQNSIKSNWIFFESGYAYSRGIKVVPIGFDGIRLEDVPAPLNILQGFNINSAASLNNIIAVINKEFDLSFSNIFDQNFFIQFIDKSSIEVSSELLQHVEGIICRYYPKVSSEKSKTAELSSEWSSIFESTLDEMGEQYTKDRENKYYGLGYQVFTKKESDKTYPEFIIDPLSVNRIRPILAKLNKLLYDGNSDRNILRVILNPPYELPFDHYLISSRLINTEVEFGTSQPNLLFKYKDILFRINIWDEYERGRTIKRKELVLIIDPMDEEHIPIVSLIHLLLDQRIIQRR